MADRKIGLQFFPFILMFHHLDCYIFKWCWFNSYVQFEVSHSNLEFMCFLNANIAFTQRELLDEKYFDSYEYAIFM